MTDFLNYFTNNFIFEFVEKYTIFFVPAILLYFSYTTWFTDSVGKGKIQTKKLKPKKIKHDVIWSAVSRFIVALIGVGVAWAIAGDKTLIYTDFSEYGWLYATSTLLGLIILYDLYFYAIHRWVHTPFLMNKIHKLHHVSTDPTPFTAYSLHPLETILEFGIVPLSIFVIPMHPITFLIWQIFVMGFAIYAHMGFEFMPKWWVHNPLTKYINTPTHHNIHHTRLKYNFSMYTNFLDRIFGTQHPDYEKTFDEVQERRFAKGEV